MRGLKLENFFQELRNIQKKERGNSSLSRVGDDFYKKVNEHIDALRHDIENDPFSEEKHNSLNKSIAMITEIYEKREHKIADIAIMNIHRSYHLFTGKPQFDFLDSTPLNLTSEEEKFYFSIIDTLKIHRERVSTNAINEIESNKFNQNKDNIINDNTKSESENSKSTNLKNIKSNKEKNFQNDNLKENNISNRIEDIKKAKIIKDEKKENITKQIFNSKTNPKTKNINSKNTEENINTNSNNTKENINTNSKNNSINNTKVSNKKTSEENIKKDKDNAEKNSSSNPINKNPPIKNELSNSKNKNNLKDPNEQFINLEDEEEEYLNNSREKIKINNKVLNKTVLLFEDMPSIIGVDTKVYGPFRSQDVAVLPTLNAEIIVKNRKGRFLKI
jgi:DNA replication factor GINS